MPISQDHPIRSELMKDRPARSPWLQDALAIVDGVDDRHAYTFVDLMTLAGKEELDQQIMAALSFLSTCRCPIFEARIVLKGQNGDVFLDPDVSDRVLKNETITHPETGAALNNPAEHAFLRYDLLKEPAPEPEKEET